LVERCLVASLPAYRAFPSQAPSTANPNVFALPREWHASRSACERQRAGTVEGRLIAGFIARRRAERRGRQAPQSKRPACNISRDQASGSARFACQVEGRLVAGLIARRRAERHVSMLRGISPQSKRPACNISRDQAAGSACFACQVEGRLVAGLIARRRAERRGRQAPQSKRPAGITQHLHYPASSTRHLTIVISPIPRQNYSKIHPFSARITPAADLHIPIFRSVL